MTTLETRIGELITAVGADIKNLETKAKPFYIPFGRTGNLAIFTGPRLYLPDDVELMGAIFSLTTAPTGSPATFDVFKNGSPTFSSEPAILENEFLSSTGTLTGVTTFTARTDYLQVRCSQVGSTVPGSDLAVVLKMRLV